jgi:hypothetical protein
MKKRQILNKFEGDEKAVFCIVVCKIQAASNGGAT